MFCLYICKCAVCIPGASRRPEGGAISSGTGVTDLCELPCGFRGLNPGALQEQQVPLTAEPSLKTLSCIF